jgi:hypothetical protein
MLEDEAKKLLTSRISVTRQKVIIAKSKILDLAKSTPESDRIIREFLKQVDAGMPAQVVLHPTVDPVAILHQAADTISWRIAAAEAIWELLHVSLLIPTSPDYTHTEDHLSWTTVIPGSGGNSGGWSFPEYVLPVPRTLSIPPSQASQPYQFLADHDLFLHELSVSGMHSIVEESLREAVRCLRFDLFTAAAAMLGKASEGAWLDLAGSLLSAIAPADQAKVLNQRRNLESPVIGISKKIDEVIALYQRQDLYKNVSQTSGVALQDLRTAAVWSDTVRDSRNTMHFGVQPSIPNTYDKVVALLMGAVPHLRTIYKLKRAADAATAAYVQA